MSPILVRPVREQFEHDRVIRLLQQRYKRKFEVAINPGAEQNSPVEAGELTLYPDLVLFADARAKRVEGTVEVETGESVTVLEAMAQWAPLSRLRAPFVLYVPPGAVDTARRLCAEFNISVAEIWTYHMAVDQVRFTMVHRGADAGGRTRAADKKSVKAVARKAPAAEPAKKRAKKAAPKKA
ncbi:MAG: hypothetical protein AB1635_16910, partial [Acidobacteriota bacterium]